jgi:hypothetical protein
MIPTPSRPRLEVADVLRAHGDAYRAAHPVSAMQARVMRRLASCRTAALGGHRDTCAGCGFARVSYNSCRDRHCPKCQATRRAAWLDDRLGRLLPVPYFHVVFTLPDTLHPLVLHNPAALYDLLFRAAAGTLLTLAADPNRLGARVGFTAILHTWGQNLLFHPHLHCVVTGGGLSPDGVRWVAGNPRYFLPVRVLGKLFRGKFLAGLRAAYAAGELTLSGSAAGLADPPAFGGWSMTCTAGRGSCTPSPRSADRSTCSATWAGTRTGSRSPTPGWWRSTTGTCPSPGRTTPTAAGSR